MKKNKIFAVTFILVLAVFLAACGGKKEGAGEGGSDTLTLLTGGTGGTYYPLGGEMAKIMTDKTDYDVTSVTSGASTENMTKVQKGEGSLALVQTDIASYGVEGKLMFEEDGPMDKVTAVGALYPETIQIVTLADSDINSVEDLKGKRVSVGDSGSGTMENAKQILEVHGLSIDDLKAQYLAFDESTELLQDGQLDAAFLTAGAPTASVDSLAALADVKVIQIADDKIDALIDKYPYYAKEVIPADTYGIEGETQTVAVLAMMIANGDLSEDQVYDLTKALFDNVDSISHSKGDKISAEAAVQGVGIPFHPGAEKYFKEKGLLE